MNLLEIWKFYEQDKTLEGYSPATLKGYKVQTALLYRYFGDQDINTITMFDLKKYLLETGGHLKPSSLGARIRFIRAFFKWASDEGYCESNPARKLREPRLGNRIPKAFSEEDTELLREACNTYQEHALIEFTYSTGCRVGEVSRVNINDINWENRSLVVIGKGNKQREVYFSLKAKIWLQWYLNSRNDDNPALFITQRRPYRRLSIGMIRYVIKRVGRQAHIEKSIYPHLWRHSFATHLLNKGCPLEGVQDLMGHAKLETTKIYCSLSGARRKNMHDTFF